MLSTARVSCLGFQLQDETRFQLPGFLQILLQGGELFSVVQCHSGALLRGGLLHVHSFESSVVVYHQLVVGGEPYVELGAVATDGVRLHQCGNGVLCRAVGFPEAAVGDNLGGLCLYAAAGGKQ